MRIIKSAEIWWNVWEIIPKPGIVISHQGKRTDMCFSFDWLFFNSYFMLIFEKKRKGKPKYSPGKIKYDGLQ